MKPLKEKEGERKGKGREREGRGEAMEGEANIILRLYLERVKKDRGDEEVTGKGHEPGERKIRCTRRGLARMIVVERGTDRGYHGLVSI